MGRPWRAGSRPSRLVLVRWPSTVVAVMWPPVSPNTPLLSMMQVTFSPRAAVCRTSWRPSLTMSPSPCTVNTIGVGPGPLDPGGQGGRPAVQGLEHLDVEVVGERGVAADPEDGDGPLHETELVDRLQRAAHGDRLAASGAEVVGTHVDEVGDEVVDQAGGLRRRPVGGHEPAHAATTRSIRRGAPGRRGRGRCRTPSCPG